VDALPESCVNLEIQTRGQDSVPKTGEPHLCERLRSVLPRMRNVALGLRYLCSGLLGLLEDGDTLPSLSSQDAEHFLPIALPNIQTLLLWFRYGDLDQEARYETRMNPLLGGWLDHTKTAYGSVMAALQGSCNVKTLIRPPPASTCLMS
jgi:hypothetical protein